MRLHGRRDGVTMVLVAILMTVLLGMAAMAFDLSRMFVMRAQLQTVADASALAGAVELARQRIDQAVDSSVHYATLNRVESNLATVAAADVEVGLWDYTAGAFTPVAPADWATSTVNAVRVNAHYTASTTFGRVFDLATSPLNTQAIGAVGYVAGTSCLKPWAVSYENLLIALYPPPTTPDPRTYDLTPDDVTRLTAMGTEARIPLLLGGSNQYQPGNIGQVIVNNPWNGNSPVSGYQHWITSPDCSNLEVGPGTWLDALPGAGAGQSSKSVAELCGLNGNPKTFSCNDLKVKMAVWDYNNSGSGGNLQYHVKFVGAFAITDYQRGNTGSDPDQLFGYFTTMASSGGFSPNPTPLIGMVALVR